MLGRYSSNPVDKVSSIAFPFLKHKSRVPANAPFPIYDPSISLSVAWDQLISSIASSDTHYTQLNEALERDVLRQANHAPTVQLLCLFPHPSRHYWFPSWAQVLKYPDVSVRDNHDDPAPIMKGIDHSLEIEFGRIYRGCSLQLTQPPTSEKQATYFCTMDGKGARLEATVPGIELHLDSATKYVLVDISPDYSLWPASHFWMCQKTKRGHEHLPIWQESVVLVCEEVDTLPRPAKRPFGVMEYYLRRVTTLKWDCRLAAEPGPGRWLPFEPSLVHIRSVFCSAQGPSTGFPHHLFCDPAVDTGLWDRWDFDDRWKWPVYEVFLV